MDEVVQNDVVSEETALPTPDVLPKEGGAPDQPLSEARVRELLSELVEPFKRQAQSASDRAQAALDRARLAEDTLAGMEGGLREIDPDATELARLKARDRHYQARDAFERQRQQMVAVDQSFHANMHQFITEAGVDPNDKGIDWGNDAKDYWEKQRRILVSVGKIQKGKIDRTKQDAEDKVAKERREAGIDSVDSSASLGAGGSDAEFLKKFGAGEIPYNKQNVERADKIMKK
uniref:Uncharacterized protein n=1 Tax=viral metagenome TaxID=1070528 RepID=A0A6H1ZZD6_9ZZZZ